MTSPWYKDIADRYELKLDYLRIIQTEEKVTMGYCVLECEDREYAYLYKDRMLLAEGDDFYVYLFLILRLFIDKYSTGKYELPELTEIQVVGQSEEEAIKENYNIMKIMLRPLDTYEDLLARFEEVKRELACDPKKVETFDGHESQENGKKALNGKFPDYEDYAYRVTKFVEEDVWDIFSKKERSNDLKFMFRIYGRKYLHEYILNNHIGAVG